MSLTCVFDDLRRVGCVRGWRRNAGDQGDAAEQLYPRRTRARGWQVPRAACEPGSGT